MAQTLYVFLALFLAVVLFVSAWQWTFRAGYSLIRDKKNSDETLCSVSPPDEIIGYLWMMFVIFSSFAVWYFYNMCRTLSSQTVEFGYIVLSAVAKTVLHALLAVTSLGALKMEEGENSRKKMEKMYDKGFAVAGGVWFGVVSAFLCLHCYLKHHKRPENKIFPPTFFNINLRWVDYTVSAAIMWATLSVAWGVYRVEQVVLGSIFHSVAMILSGYAEKPSGLVDKIPFLRMHLLAAVIHIVSAFTIFTVANVNGVLNVGVPYSSTAPKWAYEKPPGNICPSTPPEDATIAKLPGKPTGGQFYLAWGAFFFALWSGTTHLIVYVASVSKQIFSATPTTMQLVEY